MSITGKAIEKWGSDGVRIGNNPNKGEEINASQENTLRIQGLGREDLEKFGKALNIFLKINLLLHYY